MSDESKAVALSIVFATLLVAAGYGVGVMSYSVDSAEVVIDPSMAAAVDPNADPVVTVNLLVVAVKGVDGSLAVWCYDNGEIDRESTVTAADVLSEKYGVRAYPWWELFPADTDTSPGAALRHAPFVPDATREAA